MIQKKMKKFLKFSKMENLKNFNQKIFKKEQQLRFDKTNRYLVTVYYYIVLIKKVNVPILRLEILMGKVT